MADIATLDGVAIANVATLNGTLAEGGTVNGVTWPAPAVTKEFLGFSNNENNLTTYTFAAHDLGTIAADRIIIIAAMGNDNTRTFVAGSSTIGGIGVTAVAQTGGNSEMAIAQAAVPSGATGDIVCTWSGGLSSMGLGVWSMYGANPTVHDTFTDTSSPLTGTIDVLANGALFMASRVPGASTFTWVGATEDFDSNPVAESYGGASELYATLQSGLTITATPSAAGGSPRFAAASWGPS